MKDASEFRSPVTSAQSWRPYARAFIWGLADATFFFVVPDALLTHLALRNFRRALLAGLWATAGVVLGGTVLWIAARQGHTQALLNAFDWIPGISRDLIVLTAQSLNHHGINAVATGAAVGQPFKIYAVHAGAQNIALAPFLAVGAATHLARFALTSSAAWLLARSLRNRPEAFLLRVHVYAWIGFYTAYFALVR